MGGNLGPTKTWKVTYYPKMLNGGAMILGFTLLNEIEFKKVK